MTIIYTSNTGSTKAYAEMLSQKTGYPCFALSEVNDVSGDEEIIYMGWVMAGTIQGLSEAKEKFSSIKAVCAVGMMGEKSEEELKTKNAVTEPLFTLYGSFDISKLKGMYKMMMNMMMKMMKSKLKDSKDPEELKVLELLDKGFNFVKEENLNKVLEFLGFETVKEENSEE
ncbi:MAG: flavodoxin domain-containing protein [Acutalibacteraceae bacterium]